MSLETGISRIGTVIGASFGFLMGWYLFESGYWGLSSVDEHDRFSDGTIFMIASAIGVVGFILTFFAVKLVDKTINWIIRGFKE